MADSLDEQLQELDKKRDKIIHDYFVEKQKQLDDQMKESTKYLKDHANDEGSEQDG